MMKTHMVLNTAHKCMTLQVNWIKMGRIVMNNNVQHDIFDKKVQLPLA